MGAIVKTFSSFINTILDIVVIKTGIVISETDLLAILSKEYPEKEEFTRYEEFRDNMLRMRSEDFEEYCWTIRKRLGEWDENDSPMYLDDIKLLSEWQKKGYDYMAVHERFFQLMSEQYNTSKPNLLDPGPIIQKLIGEKVPLELIYHALKNIMHSQNRSNIIFPVEEILWDGGVELKALFEREHIPLEEGKFIDQKLVNYLQANPDKLECIHWRNFERLTAEFFGRLGYIVELGPGTNDGGIDVRVYDKGDISAPYIIIQCKRHKASNQVKIETIKSFYTDVKFENAKKGLIATTSKIASGGKKVVSIRNYPLQFAENNEIKNWVNKMTKR